MIVRRFDIEGVAEILPRVFVDERGYFFESYSQRDFNENVAQGVRFVQDNESRSVRGVVRGLHFQRAPYSQAKLVRVVQGKVLDVAVDLRKDSPTYGRHVEVLLEADLHNELFIPKGFAHGFSVLSDVAVFQYKCDEYYNPESEDGIAWNDPDIGIYWRLDADEIILSEKDMKRLTLKQRPGLCV